MGLKVWELLQRLAFVWSKFMDWEERLNFAFYSLEQIYGLGRKIEFVATF
jgi:hypothetical protein